LKSEDKDIIIRQATSTRPLIRVVDHEGVRAVIKDFSRNGFFFRNVAGRFLIWREARAYRKLTGLEGVPRLLAVGRGPSLVVEAVTGIDLKVAAKQKKLPPGIFDVLTGLVDGIHERGVAHCDLKASGNVLVRPDGGPVIIDWGASISRTEFRFFPLNMIYNRFVLDDYRAITKFKLRYMPETVGEEEKSRYVHRSPAERTIRAVRDTLRKWLQSIV
jgi:RIO-like serine/threonine protein kinase